jgi:hypothetical protein
MERAQVTPLGSAEAGLRVGFGLRDESATIVGFCPSASGVSAPLPHLEAGGTTATQEGGILQSGDAEGTFSVFSPISAQEVTVYRGRTALARLTFSSPAPTQTCDIDAPPPFAVLACGVVVEVRWKTAIDPPLRPVSFVDITTRDCDSGRSAGYMYRGTAVMASNLAVRFGFWSQKRPKPICVKAIALVVRSHAGGDKQQELHPPLGGVIRLTTSKAS